MLTGVDALNPPSGVELQVAGIAFVCVYSRILTRAMVEDYQAHSIAIVIVFETTGTDFVDGSAQGVTDAKVADTVCNAVGLSGAPVYFAIDTDTTDYLGVANYLDGTRSVIGLPRNGVYGSYEVVSHALNVGGLVTYAWQTYAWSGGALDPRVNLYQHLNGQTLAGHTVDLDRTVFSDTDFGQYQGDIMTPQQSAAIADAIVRSLYLGVLHRPVDPSGLTAWSGPIGDALLQGDNAAVDRILSEFATQQEAAQDLAFASSAPAEITSLKAAVAALQTDGPTVAEVESDIAKKLD